MRGAMRAFVMLSVLLLAGAARAEGANPYPVMAPAERYAMADAKAEIALARTAAPTSISADATVLVLQGLTFVVLLMSETLYGRFKIFQVSGSVERT